MLRRIRDLLGGTDDLRGNGLQGTATVLDVLDTGRTIGLDNSVPSTILKARLRIELPGQEAYEFETETTSVPPAGTVAPVWVDPKRRERVFVDTDALVQQLIANAQRFVAPAAPDVTGQLERLAALRDQGALTDEEFAAAKRQLLGGQPERSQALVLSSNCRSSWAASSMSLWRHSAAL